MRTIALTIFFAGIASLPAAGAAITYTTTGPDAASITAYINAFRNDIGPLNANVAGSFGAGRREINWDGVPDAFAAPNNLPANFFNVNSPRGVVFGTPGTGFQVSANAVNPTSTPVRFGNLDPNYSTQFTTFSTQKLFTALGSNITDVSFFVPGSTTPSWTNAFGAVFADVDQASVTSIQFYDLSNALLATVFAPPADGGLSFAGIRFTAGERIGRVRITSGSIGAGAGVLDVVGQRDVVVMDDFIYAEPAAVPEPATWTLLAGGAALLAFGRRRRRV